MENSIFGVINLETVLLGGFFFLFFILEIAFPLRKRKQSWLHRVFINFCLSLIAFLVGAFLVRDMSLNLAGLVSERAYGLLHVLPLPSGVRFAAGFLLMDLTFYYWHRANHVIPLLWRFHNVHHLDPDMDVSTSFRFHFVEVLYSTAFRILQVGLLGISPTTYVVYEVCFQVETVFHHSNFRLPIMLERLLNKVIVTPRMHGIHHSTVKDETNSNYSVIFRIWDQLHGSLRLNIPQSDIDIGVAGYQEHDDNRFWDLIASPFRRQKEYWTLADGTSPVRESPADTISGKDLLE